MNRGAAHAAAGDVAPAINDFSVAIRLDPSLAQAWYDQGHSIGPTQFWKLGGEEGEEAGEVGEAGEVQADRGEGGSAKPGFSACAAASRFRKTALPVWVKCPHKRVAATSNIILLKGA